jgi:D-arabinose 1-dehydrogenase-like Zn-dependent alcohol dehydrogenase
VLLAAGLGVGDVLAPLGGTLGQGEVGHVVVWCGPVPVPLVGGRVDDVAGPDRDDRLAAGLNEPLAFGDVEGLAERIIALSRNPARQDLAKEFGATDIVAGRGANADEAVLELTGGIGVDAALECVGTGQSLATAFAIARPGSTVGVLGVPHGAEVPFNDLFFRNVGWHGGPAPSRLYIPELIDDVLEGRINPGRDFDFETDLDGVAEAYAAMDDRRATKSLLLVAAV